LFGPFLPWFIRRGFLLNVQGGWAILRQSLVRAVPVRGQNGIAALFCGRTEDEHKDGGRLARDITRAERAFLLPINPLKLWISWVIT